MSKPSEKKDFREQFADAQKKHEEDAKAFDIDEFVKATEIVYTLELPGLKVPYMILSYAEIRELNKTLVEQNITTIEEQLLHVVAKMMFKADGKTTAEKLKQLPGLKVANPIISQLWDISGFLSTLKK